MTAASATLSDSSETVFPVSCYLDIELDSICESTTNPRRTVDAASLAELTASIYESGIQVPLMVRSRKPDSGADGVYAAGEAMYEIVCGHRRFRAANELGLPHVPCIVREMSDAEALDAQIIENLQRADVPAVEEAEAFGELLARMGSIAAVSAKLGKEQPYVAKRLRLLALTLHSRDALRVGLITIDHALLLARLAEAEQNEALKWTLDRDAGSKAKVEDVMAKRIASQQERAEDKDSWRSYVWEPQSVVKLKSHIESEGGVKLSRAPWPLDEEDNLLPDVGPCSECPKNTKANAPLFGDLDIGDPTCTDGACFQAKTAGFVALRAVLDASREGALGKAVRMSWKASSVKPSIVPNDVKVVIETPGRCSETANPAKVLKQGQWVVAKKGSCPNVRPGVTMDWSDSGQRGYMGSSRKLRKPGEVLQVCIAAGCKAHKKDWEGKGATGSQGERADPAEEQRKQEEREHVEKVETAIRQKVFAAMVGKLDAATALRIVADRDGNAPAIRKELLALRPAIDGLHLEALTIFAGELRYALTDVNGYWLMNPKNGVAEDRKRLWKTAKSAGVDADAVAAKHFHDEGSIAPWSDRLYPKGVKWPKGAEPSKPEAAKAAAKPVKKAAKRAVGKTAKKVVAKKKAGAR